MYHSTRVPSPNSSSSAILQRRGPSPSFDVVVSTSPAPSSTSSGPRILSPSDVLLHTGISITPISPSSMPSPPLMLAPIAEQESDLSEGSAVGEPCTSGSERNREVTEATRVSERSIDLHLQTSDEEVQQRQVTGQSIANIREDVVTPESPEYSVPYAAEPSRHIIFPITPFYNSKNGCNKCTIWLALLFVVFLLLSIALFLVWAITSDGFRNLGVHIPNVCSSKQCIDTAFRFSTYMDPSIDPCTNFYRYSCNKFHTQAEDQRRNFIDQQKDATLRQVHALLSAPDDATSARSSKFAKLLFTSCMDAGQRASRGPAPLMALLRNLPCGPVLRECTSFNPDFYNWERHVGMLDWYSNGFNLIVYDTDVHPQDRSKMILQIRPPQLEPLIGETRRQLIALANPSETEYEPLLQASIRQNLLNEVVQQTFMRDPVEVHTQLDEVAQFIVDIDKATVLTARLTPNTTYMTIGEFTRALPEINFREALNAELTNIYKWTEDDMMAIQDFDYFAELSLIIARTPRRAVANYLMIVTGFHLQQYSNQPSIQFSWRDCVAQLSELQPVEKMYILSRQNISTEKINSFLQNVKKDFITTHRSYPLQYLGRINQMSFYIGYPRRLLSEEMVWRPFSKVNIDETNYFTSAITVLKQQRNYMLSQIGTYLDNDDTTSYNVLVPTIIYNPHVEGIVLPISFLQSPIAQPGETAPMYAIYSTLGITVFQMLSKIFWLQLDETPQKLCLDSIYRNFLNPSYRNIQIDTALANTIELSDAVKTTDYSYSKWQDQVAVHQVNKIFSIIYFTER
ncbi:hypothetical protein WR25_16284 isoform D [Diploscapter pachys]|uniref:Peptidase M13 N-terminal domain-containing protein n=1 Tax=Diploscapter pachys TaxID=2018661 RepID=A0A2A2KIK8_9BILA|nr:hypothetical protein WR25_16284 isoform D [Diploscapter pachys]